MQWIPKDKLEFEAGKRAETLQKKQYRQMLCQCNALFVTDILYHNEQKVVQLVPKLAHCMGQNFQAHIEQNCQGMNTENEKYLSYTVHVHTYCILQIQPTNIFCMWAMYVEIQPHVKTQLYHSWRHEDETGRKESETETNSRD